MFGMSYTEFNNNYTEIPYYQEMPAHVPVQDPGVERPVRRKKKKKHLFLKFILILLLVIILIAGGLFLYLLHLVSKMNVGNKDGHTVVYISDDYPIQEVEQKDPKVRNILIFGVDARGPEDYADCRSDAMIIMTIDKRNHVIKLTSLMRDTGVDIYGNGHLDKLTHAYRYGGVGLLMDTINRNFDMDIDEFFMFDFQSAANLVDIAGGVTINVDPSEVSYANNSINEQNAVYGSSAPLISEGGEQTLSGVQAISWARIRKLDSDFVRTSRQRTLITALITKVNEMNVFKKFSFFQDSVGCFETNIESMDMIWLAISVIMNSGSDEGMGDYRVPEDGLYRVQDNPWMMIVDMEEQRARLHDYIWG